MTFHLYQDKEKKWRWRAIANNNIVGDSGQGYASKGGARTAIKNFKLKCLRAEVVEGGQMNYKGAPKPGKTAPAKKMAAKKKASTKGKTK